jgi:hypothetical protein
MKLINRPHLFEESTLCFVFHGEQITASVCGKVDVSQFVISTNGSLLFCYTSRR